MRLVWALALAAGVAAASACALDRRPPPEWAAALASGHCGPETVRTLERWRARGGYRPAPPSAEGTTRYRLPTAELGVWIDVERPARTPPTLTLVRPELTRSVRFGPDCRAVTDARRLDPHGGATGAAPFTDADLVERVRTAAATAPAGGLVVYVWSPHMGLSVDGWPEVRAAAERLGLAVVPVLHPDSDPGFARREALRAGFPEVALRPAASVELVYRDALVHAPSLIVFGRARVSPVLPGYRSADGYGRYLEGFLEGA